MMKINSFGNIVFTCIVCEDSCDTCYTCSREKSVYEMGIADGKKGQNNIDCYDQYYKQFYKAGYNKSCKVEQI